MLLAIVPAAPPTRKNQRATSCPAPISANVPYLDLSRLIWIALLWVPCEVDSMACPLRVAWLKRNQSITTLDVAIREHLPGARPCDDPREGARPDLVPFAFRIVTPRFSG